MDLTRIKTRLSALTGPAREAVVDWHLQYGRDHDNDPAMWVYVVVKDDRADWLMNSPTWRELRERIRDVVAEETSPEVITYIRMWEESDTDEARLGYG